MPLLEAILGLFFLAPAFEEASASSAFLPDSTPFIDDISAQDYTSLSIFDDCNANPAQYNRWHRKIVPFKCATCAREIWSIGGNSMNPTLKSGSLLKFAMNGFGNLTPGMIVIYDPRKDVMGSPLDMENAVKYDYNIIHRIVAEQGDNYVIKGDNPETNAVCELIPKSEIKAVLMEIDY